MIATIPRPIVSIRDRVIAAHNRGKSVTYQVNRDSTVYLVLIDGDEYTLTEFDNGGPILVQSV